MARPKIGSPILSRRPGIDMGNNAESYSERGRDTTDHVREDGRTRWRRRHEYNHEGKSRARSIASVRHAVGLGLQQLCHRIAVGGCWGSSYKPVVECIYYYRIYGMTTGKL